MILRVNSTKSAGLVPNLDFLRACAVMFVLVDHTLGCLGYRTLLGADRNWLGRTGVLFFFVHTCCVLMMSLERHKGEGFFTSFYLRRIFRIYPLSIIAVLLAMIPPYAPALGVIGWLSNLALVQNLTFCGGAFGTIWSLPLEVQMYFFLPFVFLLARRSRTIWGLLALFAASVPVALWQPYHVARASVLAFFPCFLPGVLAYWLFRHVRPMLPSWGVPVTIAGVTVAMMAHPGWTYPAWTACLLLGLSIPLFRQISNPAVNRTAFEIAKYSYGIYISHSLLIVWMPPTWRSLPVYLVAVAGASVLSYHFIEHPMVRLGQRLTSGRKPTVEPLAAHDQEPVEGDPKAGAAERPLQAR